MPNRLMIISDVVDKNDKPIVVLKDLDIDSILHGRSIKSNKVITVYEKSDIDNQIKNASARNGILYVNKKKKKRVQTLSALQASNSLTV